jgi:hypothetical protein
MEAAPATRMQLDAETLSACPDDPMAVARLDVRQAELADLLNASGLVPQPPAAAGALRNAARARSRRTGWAVQ